MKVDATDSDSYYDGNGASISRLFRRKLLETDELDEVGAFLLSIFY